MNASLPTLQTEEVFLQAAPATGARGEQTAVVRRQGLSWISRAVLTAVFAAAAPLVFLTPLNHDVAATLFYARRMMTAGMRLYVDAVDNNPPLAYLLSMPIEWLAMVTGWPESRAVSVVVMALAALCLWLVSRILHAGAGEREREPRAEPVIVIVMLTILLTLLLAPMRDLGQREHLMLLLLMPYAVWCARVAVSGERSLSWSWRLAIGALATLGLCIKPHFFLAYALLMAYLVIARRSLRPVLAVEHLIVPVGAAIYLASIFLFWPAYVFEMVPLAVTHYGAYGAPLRELLTDWIFVPVAVSSVAWVILAPWVTGERIWSALVRVFALASVAFLIVYLAQLRGFGYHFLPGWAFNILATMTGAVAFVAEAARRKAAEKSSDPRGLISLAARTALLTLMAVPAGMICTFVSGFHNLDVAYARAGVRAPLVEPLIDIVHEHAAGRPIFVLSSSVNPAFPLVNVSGATFPYRYHCLWLLPAYYSDANRYVKAAYRTPDAQSPGERAFFDEVVADLVKQPPAALIVDRHRIKQGFGGIYFDFVEYYQQSPAFAELFRHYGLIARRAGYDVFVYEADPSKAAAMSGGGQLTNVREH